MLLRHQLQPAATVLECLGVRNLARKLNLSVPTVSNWNRPPGTSSKTQAGTGGHIPKHYWPVIIELAKKEGYGKIITAKFLTKPQQLPEATLQYCKNLRYYKERRNPIQSNHVPAPFLWSPKWIR